MVSEIGKKSSETGKSKKSRQASRNTSKYMKQSIRTAENKRKAWNAHLAKHPNDLKAKEDIKKARM